MGVFFPPESTRLFTFGLSCGSEFHKLIMLFSKNLFPVFELVESAGASIKNNRTVLATAMCISRDGVYT